LKLEVVFVAVIIVSYLAGLVSIVAGKYGSIRLESYCCFNRYFSLSSESLVLNCKCVLLSQSYSISFS